MEELLLKIIKTLGAEVPELSYIDEDYGQLEMLDEVGRDSYPLTFPAMLVDCASVSWSNIEGYSQKGTATVHVRLLMDCYDDTHFGSGVDILFSFLSLYTVEYIGFWVEKCRKRVQNCSFPSYSTVMQRFFSCRICRFLYFCKTQADRYMNKKILYLVGMFLFALLGFCLPWRKRDLRIISK